MEQYVIKGGNPLVGEVDIDYIEFPGSQKILVSTGHS